LGGPVPVVVNRDGQRWRAQITALGAVRQARSLRTLDRQVRQLTGRALTLRSGASGRDLAVLLGLSYQRIHQLMRRHDGQQSTAEGKR
jgi:hypothetical protein